jgi:hypothetical protein
MGTLKTDGRVLSLKIDVPREHNIADLSQLTHFVRIIRFQFPLGLRHHLRRRLRKNPLWLTHRDILSGEADERQRAQGDRDEENGANLHVFFGGGLRSSVPITVR